MKKTPQSNRDILTLTETESRLSLGMPSNKIYHFQTTANHHRFIKVWTSIADLPTSKYFVQIFFLKNVWLRNTLPTYDLAICPNLVAFFTSLLNLTYLRTNFIKLNIFHLNTLQIFTSQIPFILLLTLCACKATCLTQVPPFP